MKVKIKGMERSLMKDDWGFDVLIHVTDAELKGLITEAYRGFPLCGPCGLPCTGLSSCPDFFTCRFDLTPASRCDLQSCTRPCAVRGFKLRAVVMTNELGKELEKLMLAGEI